MGYTVLGICGPTRTGSTSFGSWVKVVLPMSSLFSDTSNPGVAKKLKHPPHISGLKDQSWKHEAYLLFPVHLDGTLLDNAKTMNAKKEFFSKFHFRCASNISSALCILLKPRKGQPPLATLMDFGSARPARKANLFSFRGPSIAAEHVSAPFRATELWDKANATLMKGLISGMVYLLLSMHLGNLVEVCRCPNKVAPERSYTSSSHGCFGLNQQLDLA
ncbi:putative PHD and RING finger domain-containing proteinc-like [Capsicum annuum]|nr:putative PHD and RING finger domain-containing proteinc-like [Capsicum annuum]